MIIVQAILPAISFPSMKGHYPMDNSNKVLTEQLNKAAKISELLGEFKDLARAEGIDLDEVIEQYNEENLPDGTEDGEYHYFRGIDMCNLP